MKEITREIEGAESVKGGVKVKKKIRGEAAIAKFVRLIDSVHPDDLDAFHEYLSKRWFNGAGLKSKH